LAIRLDDEPQPSTRTERWLRAVTPRSVLRYLPLASALGLPLAFVVALFFELARASYYGIPQGFVRVTPVDAILPFASITSLLWVMFVMFHEIEHAGVIRWIKFYGGGLRLLFFGVVVVAAVATVLEGRDWIAFMVAGIFVGFAYFLGWWLIPLILWFGRQLGRLSGRLVRARGLDFIGRSLTAVLRHLFRGMFDYPQSPLMPRLIGYIIVLLLATSVPGWLGWLRARGQEEYGVMLQGSQQQVILATYGDKTFVATEIQQHRIRKVVMLQTADLDGVEVRVERVGDLRR
jgi:hypothetical protein